MNFNTLSLFSIALSWSFVSLLMTEDTGVLLLLIFTSGTGSNMAYHIHDLILKVG